MVQFSHQSPGSWRQRWQLLAGSQDGVRRSATIELHAPGHPPPSQHSNVCLPSIQDDDPYIGLHPCQMGQQLSDSVSFGVSNHYNPFKLLPCPAGWVISKRNAHW